MSIELQLKNRILAESEKLIERYHSYHNQLHLEWYRNQRRIANAPAKDVRTPEYWNLDPKFNPFYVHRRAAAIAKSIARKIRSNNYYPEPPYIKTIPKDGGGQRELTIYQIPDAAVSTYFYSRLLGKNRHR